MIYLVYGDDIAKTRAIIVNQQKKLSIETKTELDINETTPEKLDSICSIKTIFGEPPFVLLDITSSGRKNLDPYLEVIKKIPGDTTLILVSYKDLTKTNPFLKAASGLKIKSLKNEKMPTSNVFRFLDSLADKNRKQVYVELKKLIEDDQDEIYLITMIQYLLRNLAYGIYKSPKFNTLNPYVKKKTSEQIKNFSETQIDKLYKQLYQIDKKTKTGALSPSDGLTLAVEKVLNSK